MTKSAPLDVYFVSTRGVASCGAVNEWPTREPVGRLPEEACLPDGCVEELEDSTAPETGDVARPSFSLDGSIRFDAAAEGVSGAGEANGVRFPKDP